MQNDVAMGTNRTGIKASPLDAKALQEAATLQASPPMPSTTATDLRIEYLDEAEPIGSMPPPTSVKGVFGAMKGAITGKNCMCCSTNWANAQPMSGPVRGCTTRRC